jgi:hypothetical protein
MQQGAIAIAGTRSLCNSEELRSTVMIKIPHDDTLQGLLSERR